MCWDRALKRLIAWEMWIWCLSALPSLFFEILYRKAKCSETEGILDSCPFCPEIVLPNVGGGLFNQANNVLIRSKILLFFSPGSDVFVMSWHREAYLHCEDGEELYYSYLMCVCSLNIYFCCCLFLIPDTYDVYPMLHFKGLFCLQCIHGILTWFDPFCQASLNIFHSCCL